MPKRIIKDPCAIGLSCVLYIRVSTEEQAQAGLSIDAQIKKLEAAAKERGYIIVKIFKDEGYSGTNDNRPDLKNMLAYCQHYQVDVILVIDTDRLARSESLHFSIKALLKKCGTKVESVNQPMLDDSPEGTFLDAILAAVNALQPKVTGRKTSMTLEEKVKSGWWPGWAPTGYKNIDNPSALGRFDKKIIIPDEILAPLISRLFELFATGLYTIYSLADQMEKEGLVSRNGKPLKGGDIAHILHNPFYHGRLPFKGEVYAGEHKALTTKSIFEKCQRILECHNHSADRSRKHFFLLSELIICGMCNGKYTAEHNPIKNRSYYHCSTRKIKHSNKGQNIEIAKLEAEVDKLFKHIVLPESIADKIVQKAIDMLNHTHNDIDVRREIFEDRKKFIYEKRLRIETKLAEGTMSDESYKRQESLLDKEEAQANKDLARLGQNRRENIAAFEQLILLARNIHKAYLKASPTLKKKYIALFWERIVVQDRKIKEAVPTKLFQAVLGVSDVTTPSTGAKTGYGYNQFDMAPGRRCC